jgi:hypothetical protein
MSDKVKAAFRIYSKISTEFGLTYNLAPVNVSHPEAHNIRLLGSMDSMVCQPEEFCPNTNIFYSDGTITRTGYVNWDSLLYFPDSPEAELLRSVLSSQSEPMNLVIKKCESLLKIVISNLSVNEIGNFYKCIKTLWTPAEEYKNHMYNCIGFAFGIKEFVMSNIYIKNPDLTPEENVKRFIHIIHKKYSNKLSNIMELTDKLDSESTNIKCYNNFEEFYADNRTYKNNDVVLYFSHGFKNLLHGARFINELTEDIKVDSFVSKLGHGHLVSHSAIDAFNREETGYGEEVCYISGRQSHSSDGSEL